MTSHMDKPMFRSIKASEFKAKCLALIDQVADTGNPIVITKNGKPLVELVDSSRHMEGKGLTIQGDIISPIDVEWDALK
jgi:prevent-host-death family protein